MYIPPFLIATAVCLSAVEFYFIKRLNNMQFTCPNFNPSNTPCLAFHIVRMGGLSWRFLDFSPFAAWTKFTVLPVAVAWDGRDGMVLFGWIFLILDIHNDL